MMIATVILSIITGEIAIEHNVQAADNPSNPIDKTGWSLTEHDEFNKTTLDESLWFPRYLGFRTSLDRGNADYYFNDGSIVLRVDEDTPTYFASGDKMKVSSIQTAQGDFHQGSTVKHHDEPYISNFSQMYGYFEIRAKGQSDRSGHSAFWFNTDDPSEYQPGARNKTQHTEIDVFENYKRNQYLFNLYNPANHGIGSTGGGTYDFDFSEDFHTYAMEWSPKEVKFYVDNKLIQTRNGSNMVKKPMFSYLSLYVDTWGGDSAATFPAEFEIDYFRAYRMEGTLTLQVGDGEYKYLTPDQLSYEYILPEGTDEIPEVRVHDKLNESSVKVTQANKSTMTAVIELTEEDGSIYTYQVKFKSDLSKDINYAQSLLDLASVGEELGQYPKEAHDLLMDVIVDSEAVLNDEEATVADEYAAHQQLKLAIERFKSARIMTDGTHRYAVYDYFNGLPTGSEPLDWNIHSGGKSTIQEIPSESNKSIHINATSGGKTGVEKTFDSLTGKVTIETKVRSDSNNWVVLPYIYDGNTMVYSARFSGGQISVNNGGTWQNIQSYVRGEWYDIKTVIDTDTDTFDVFINGGSENGGSELLNAKLRAPKEGISKVDYHTTYSGDSMYVNYLKVYKVEPVDKRELESLLEIAKSITNEEEYTDESYSALQAAINESEILLEDGKVTQQEVDSIVVALQKAIDNLVVLDTVSPVGHFTINAGAKYTNKSTVSLILEAEDNSSGVHRLRYSTDGERWTDWYEYTNSKEITIPSGDGEKTVFVEFKDKAGNISETYQQKIILDTTAPLIQLSGHQDSYSIDASINISCNIEDNLSGVASQDNPIVAGPAYSFEVGVNKIIVSAIDKAGNKAEAEIRFTVTVDYDGLSRLTEAFVEKQGVANSLTKKLQSAKASATKGNIEAVNGLLKAYEHQLKAGSGKSISDENAKLLINLSKQL